MEEKLGLLKQWFGSYTKLAYALDITPMAINYWRVSGKIPAGSAVKIERLTNGEIKAVDLV